MMRESDQEKENRVRDRDRDRDRNREWMRESLDQPSSRTCLASGIAQNKDLNE